MKLKTLGAVTAAFAVCAAAGAQTTPYQPIGASVRAGIFLPTNKSTSDDIGTGFFAFGVDYDLTKTSILGQGLGVGLSVDYYQRDNVGDIPVLLNAIYRTGRLSFNAGVGVGFQSLPGDDKTGFAYGLGVDYTLSVGSTLPIFVGARFLGADRSQVDGFGIYAGVRF